MWFKVTNEDVSLQDLKLEPSHVWEGACGGSALQHEPCGWEPATAT